MIEANICLNYGANVWQAAVLNVDSGLLNEGATDFVKISKAIQQHKDLILPPSINKSRLGFYPQEDKILYGIKPVTTLNYEDARFIIENRPYQSLQDFHNKCVENGVLTERKTINLIKAGMFNEFGDNYKLMIEYIKNMVKVKSVSKVSTKKLYNYLPSNLKKEADLYLSLTDIKKGANILEYKELYHDFNINIINFFDGENVDHKSLKKEVDKNTQNLTTWFKTNEAIQAKEKYECNELWKKHCLGTKEKWEFDALNTYLNKNDVENYSIPETWNLQPIHNNNALKVIGKTKKGYNIYKEYCIAGTVIDNNPNKNTITLITPNGVIDLKVYTYKYYNEKVMKEIVNPNNNKKEKVCIDPSWCQKGTNLVAIGFERNGSFYCSHKNHIVNHSLVKILGKTKEGKTVFQFDKKK